LLLVSITKDKPYRLSTKGTISTTNNATQNKHVTFVRE